MGSVWLADDLALDAPCAIKVINPEEATSDEVRARFAREARASAQLRSPHVVDVFDYGDWGGTLFIAMEFLEGEDLGARLDRMGAMDAVSTYRVVAHVARALMLAHARGIVHRDLKPENVFLVPVYDEEIAKVLDFGIAHLDDISLEDKATRTGSFLGTPYYVSPEQARGWDIDHRTDLWSLGVIAFQCLTGRLPFESSALGELMGLILLDPLPRPTALSPALPSGIDDWWQRAAARDRGQRFQSAKELADALGRALGIETLVSLRSVSRCRRDSLPAPDEVSGIFTPPTVERSTGLLPDQISRPGEKAGLDVPSVPAEGEGPDAPESNTCSLPVTPVGQWWLRLIPRSVIARGLALLSILAVGTTISVVVVLAQRARLQDASRASTTAPAATIKMHAPTPQVTALSMQHTAPADTPAIVRVDMLSPESTTGHRDDDSHPLDIGSVKPTRTSPPPPKKHVVTRQAAVAAKWIACPSALSTESGWATDGARLARAVLPGGSGAALRRFSTATHRRHRRVMAGSLAGSLSRFEANAHGVHD